MPAQYTHTHNHSHSHSLHNTVPVPVPVPVTITHIVTVKLTGTVNTVTVAVTGQHGQHRWFSSKRTLTQVLLQTLMSCIAGHMYTKETKLHHGSQGVWWKNPTSTTGYKMYTCETPKAPAVHHDAVCFSGMAALLHRCRQASGSWTCRYLQGKSFLSFFHSFTRVRPSSTQQLGNFFFHVIVRRELGGQCCSGAAAYNLITTRFELQGGCFPVCLYVALPVSVAVALQLSHRILRLDTDYLYQCS